MGLRHIYCLSWCLHLNYIRDSYYDKFLSGLYLIIKNKKILSSYYIYFKEKNIIWKFVIMDQINSNFTIFMFLEI